MNSRPIKLRFFSPKQNKFIHQPRIWVSDEGLLQYEYGEGEDLIITQWTGLKDKNNIEIFEGDLIKTTGEDIGSILGENPKYNYGEIRWLCESWKICEENIGATHLGDFVSCDCCPVELEVIGNIFQNSLDKFNNLT